MISCQNGFMGDDTDEKLNTEYYFEVVLSMKKKREEVIQPFLRFARLGGPRGEGIRRIVPK